MLRFCTCVLVAVVSLAGVAATPSTRTAQAAGEASWPNTGELALRGVLSGEARGTLRASIRLDGHHVPGGDWSATLLTTNADGSESEAGTISGTVDPGTALGADGRVHALKDLRLTITSGNGEFAGVTSGSGSLDVRLGANGEPFHATLTLTF